MPVLEYGLVVTSVVRYCNELRHRGCSVALRMHMHTRYWHTRARARVSVYMHVRVEIKRNTRVTGLWCSVRVCKAPCRACPWMDVDVSSLAPQDSAYPNHFSSAHLSSIEVAASVRPRLKYSSLASYKQTDSTYRDKWCSAAACQRKPANSI